MKPTALVLAFSLLAACGASQQKPKTGADEAVPALSVPSLDGPLERGLTLFAVTLYLPSPPPDDVHKLASELRDAHFPGLHIAEGAPDPDKEPELPVMFSRIVTAAEDPVPGVEELAYFGVDLSQTEVTEVSAMQHGVGFLFLGDQRSVATELPRQNAFVLALAERLGGYVWDVGTSQMYSRESYEKRLDAQTSVLDHVSMHVYRDGELLTIVTLGMPKFGLPDLVVRHVSAGEGRSMGMLVNVLCTLLIQGERPGEGGRMPVALDALRDPKLKAAIDTLEGADERTDLLLRRIKGDDDEGELLEVFFGEADDRFVHERQNAAIAGLFGSSDGIVYADHDAELLAVSERAKQKLEALRPRFEKGLEPNEQLLVKAPFKTSHGGDEWMWVEVVRWRGQDIDGILMNDPEDVPGVVSGAKVHVKQDELFDYLFKHADGTTEGNETAEILTRGH